MTSTDELLKIAKVGQAFSLANFSLSELKRKKKRPVRTALGIIIGSELIKS